MELFLSLVLLEFLFRTIQAFLPQHNLPHPVPYYYLPESSPDARNCAYSKSKPTGTFRIAVVGDSFTFAGKGQFDDAFPARLQPASAELNDRQVKVEVLNLGVPGNATYHEVSVIEQVLDKLSP